MSDRVYPIKSSWSSDRILVVGPLTDRKIAKYQAAGWYSDEIRELRRERNLKRMLRREEYQKREGNFVNGPEGRLIYSPLQ